MAADKAEVFLRGVKADISYAISVSANTSAGEGVSSQPISIPGGNNHIMPCEHYINSPLLLSACSV